MNKPQSQQIHREKGGKVPDHRNVSVLQLTLQGVMRWLFVELGIDFV
jgi:hypothetical protein